MPDPTFILIRVPNHIAKALNRLATVSGRTRDELSSILMQRAVLTELIAEKRFAEAEKERAS